MKTTLCLSLTLLLCAACSSGSGDDLAGATSGSSTGTTSNGTGGSTTTSTGASTGPGSGGSTPNCDGPGAKTPDAPMLVTSVQTTVVDVSGAPAPNIPAQVCGKDKCTSGMTNATGSILDAPNQTFNTPAFKYGDGLLYGKFCVPLTQAATTFAQLVTPKLPASGAVMTAGADATSGPVTLSIPASAQIVIDIVTYDDDSKMQFRAAEMPVDQAAAVDPAIGLEMLFAVAPVDSEFCPAAKVTVQNSQGWSAGTAVEFWIHGVDTSEEYVAYGKWTKVSDGQVSADGATIVTADAGGLPSLTVFGIKRQ